MKFFGNLGLSSILALGKPGSETVLETERELSALMSHCDVIDVDRDGFPKQSHVDGPKHAEAYAAEHHADHDQTAWKRHPNKAMRRANLLAKRQRDAAFADQELARRDPGRQQRAEVIAEVRRLVAEAKAKAAAAPDDEPLQEDCRQAQEMAQAATRSLEAMQKAADATPLFGVRAAKHDVERGSRRIRRQVSHDFRKGRKPVQGHKGGSVPLTAVDLVELHGRFAAAVLGIDGYNAALREAQKLGRLKHLVPLAPKGTAEAASDERKAA